MKFVRLRVTRQINFDFNLTLKNNCICSVKRRKRRKTKTRKKSHAQMCSMINFVYRKIKVVKEIINNSVWNIENHCVWVSFSLYSFYLDRVDAKTCQEILWCFCRLCVYVVNIQIALKTGKNRREKKKETEMNCGESLPNGVFQKSKKETEFFFVLWIFHWCVHKGEEQSDWFFVLFIINKFRKITQYFLVIVLNSILVAALTDSIFSCSHLRLLMGAN